MDKQTIEFSVTVKNDAVTAIERSYILHPEIRFNGNSIKWYEDKKNRSEKNRSVKK